MPTKNDTLPPTSLACRALHGLPQQRKQRQQDHIRGLKSQAIKKTVFSHRAIAEHLAELERENAAVAKVYYQDSRSHANVVKKGNKTSSPCFSMRLIRHILRLLFVINV